MKLDRGHLNLLLLHKNLNPYGGITSVFRELAAATLSYPVTLHFGYFTPYSEEQKALLTIGRHRVVLFSKGGLGNVNVIASLRSYIRSEDICLIFACSLRAYFLASAATGFSRKVVFWGHSSQSLAFTPGPKVLLFKILARKRWLVFNSQFSRDSFVNQNRPRCRVIYNGVRPPANLSQSFSRKAFDIPEGAFVLTYIAEYTPWKDHRTLLLAFKRLAEKRKDVFLFLCGPLKSIEAELINPILGKDELKHRVILLGSQGDIYTILSNTDVYVHPCYLEGFGNSVLEAMMAGVPIVAADAGALPEVVGKTAILFPPQNPASLAQAIEALFLNRPLSIRLAREARARAMQEFSSSTFAKRFLDTAEEILTDLGDSFHAD